MPSNDLILVHEILISIIKRSLIHSLVISKFKFFLLLVKELNLIGLTLQLPDLFVNFKFEPEHLSVDTAVLS